MHLFLIIVENNEPTILVYLVNWSTVQVHDKRMIPIGCNLAINTNQAGYPSLCSNENTLWRVRCNVVLLSFSCLVFWNYNERIWCTDLCPTCWTFVRLIISISLLHKPVYDCISFGKVLFSLGINLISTACNLALT